MNTYGPVENQFKAINYVKCATLLYTIVDIIKSLKKKCSALKNCNMCTHIYVYIKYCKLFDFISSGIEIRF